MQAGGRQRAGVTPRAELARVARSAALAVPGVLAANPGPEGRYLTTYADAPIDGVVAAAQGEGRFSVDLFLTGGLVALHPLGEQVREAVAVAARKADLADRLGDVTVTFLDVSEGNGRP